MKTPHCKKRSRSGLVSNSSQGYENLNDNNTSTPSMIRSISTSRSDRIGARARSTNILLTIIPIAVLVLCLSQLPSTNSLTFHNWPSAGAKIRINMGLRMSKNNQNAHKYENRNYARSRSSGSASSSPLRYTNYPLHESAASVSTNFSANASSLFRTSKSISGGSTSTGSGSNQNKYTYDYNRKYSQIQQKIESKRSSTHLHMMVNYVQLFTDTKDSSSTDECVEKSWLSWMTGGTPRGVADVKMRDPVELGGVPRSDRYASRDWLHNTANLPNSAILKDIRFPVVSMTLWGAAISVIHRKLCSIGRADLAMNMCIPTQPHALMVSSLGLLLVFRTNTAYQRFAEGRKIWEDILTVARDLSRLGKLYEKQIGTNKLRRVNKLLAAFPYLLRFRIRPNSIMRKLDDPSVERDAGTSLILYQDHATSDSDAEAAAVASDEEITGISRRKPRELYWVGKSTLPWRLLPNEAMKECARAQNRPLWVCDRLSKELHSVPDQENWTARERLTLLSKVEKLSGSIGACERIHQTVVPLNYARHALRSLTMWLLSLPFALVKDLGLLTGPILFIISWMLFGVYEIGYSIEDPFQGTLRLSILCDAIRRDVLGDEIIRNTAFRLDKEAMKRDALVNGSGESFEDELDDELDYEESALEEVWLE